MIRVISRWALGAFAFALTACGGGGGGGGPGTIPPPPPAPPPAASAFPLTQSATFSTITGFRAYSRPSGVIDVSRFGVAGRSSSVTFAFDAATNSYTVKDGTYSATFGPANRATSGAIDTYTLDRDTLEVYNNIRTGTSQASAPVQLNHLSYGKWRHADFTTLDKYTTTYFLFGYPTSNMPTTGSASYKTMVTGNRVNLFQGEGEQDVTGSATFTANFANATVNTVLTLDIVEYGLPWQPFTGTGAISGNQFNGQFTSTDQWFVSGEFAGGFFGPGADEMGYTFAIKRGNPDPYCCASVQPPLTWVTGVVVGSK